jgi:hypothetical protein
MKKICLLHFPPSSFAGIGSTKCTSMCMNLEHAPEMRFNLAPGATTPTVQTVGRLGCLQPPTVKHAVTWVIRPRSWVKRSG